MKHCSDFPACSRLADIGYGYGYLLSKQISASYHSLLYSILGDQWYDKLLIEALGAAIDWQWRDYLVSLAVGQAFCHPVCASCLA